MTTHREINRIGLRVTRLEFEFRDANHHSRHYVRLMKKPKIYLIPGTMCNEKLWGDSVKGLSDSYDLEHLAIPLGESIDAIVDSLVGKMVGHDVNLLGFSFGGYLASLIAIKIPNRVQTLIIISNSPCSLSSHETQTRQRSLALINKYGYKGISSKKASSLLDGTLVNQKALNTILEMDAELGGESLVNQLIAGDERRDLALDLSELCIPITLIHSESDPLVNRNWITGLQFTCSVLTVVSLPGSGHMLPLEQPLEIANCLRIALTTKAKISG